jgi:ABC-2 type transport system permease protein
MQSKIDFALGLFGFFLIQISGILFLILIFERIPSINDWTFNQMIFIYGFSQIPRGIDHLFTDNIWLLSMRLVIHGEFDRYLLRPMNLFIQLIFDKFQADAIGELFIGFALIALSVSNGTFKITPLSILFLVISIVAGSIIFTSIKLFFASLAFWIKDSFGILQLAYNAADFAKYPISVFPKLIQILLTIIIPFAFVAFYPASYFLSNANLFKTIGVEIAIAIIAWLIAYKTFIRGTRIYESSGN